MTDKELGYAIHTFRSCDVDEVSVVRDDDDASELWTGAVEAIVSHVENEIDPKAADDDWLRAVATEEVLDGFRFRNAETGYEVFRDRGGKWDYMGRWVKPPENRGDVRRLCAALGIELRKTP